MKGEWEKGKELVEQFFWDHKLEVYGEIYGKKKKKEKVERS